MITSGVGLAAASASTYAPRAVPAAAPVVPSGEPGERSKVGTFCRVRHSPAGRSVCSRTVFQATTVSFASAGRTTSRPGIARSAARCSIGWWVGPSSPSPIESCVHTYVTGSFISAASRTAGRM